MTYSDFLIRNEMHVPDNTPMPNTMCERMNIDDEIGVARLFFLGQMIRSDDVVNNHENKGFKSINRSNQADLNQMIIMV